MPDICVMVLNHCYVTYLQKGKNKTENNNEGLRNEV